ncbi:MAG: hypothetical protein PHU42_03620 [Patescibacteria group bacterium]|nr:hypothetical protein [Patescibacteria group bacterium]
MKKILFPFRRKDRKMSKYWWHRLSIIAFIIAVVVIPISIFVSTTNSEDRNIQDCMSLNYKVIYQDQFYSVTNREMKLEQNKSSYNDVSYKAEMDKLKQENDDIYKAMYKGGNECDARYSNRQQNLAILIISFIATFYLLQLIYYKIFLYIVLGEDKSEIKAKE